MWILLEGTAVRREASLIHFVLSPSFLGFLGREREPGEVVWMLAGKTRVGSRRLCSEWGTLPCGLLGASLAAHEVRFVWFWG